MTQTFEQWAESEGLDMSVDWKGDLTSPVTAGALRGWEAAQSAGQEAVALTDEEILAIAVHHFKNGYDNSPKALSAFCDCVRSVITVYAPTVNGGERELGQVIDERDQYHDAADKLAGAIAKHFGVEIGEHSNLNCPWQNALDHIAQATKRAADAQQVGGMSKVHEWNAEGERCMKCGDKDWMNTECSGKPAVDARAEEVAALSPILRGMIEGGSYDDPAELYAADFEAPDGDVFVRRAADLLEEYAALTSPAQVGGDEREVLIQSMKNAQEWIAASRARCDEIERDRWDALQRVIDFLACAALPADGGEAANLEGLRDKLFDGRQVTRDAEGWYYHPALPNTDEDVNLENLLAALRIESVFVSMESDDSEAADRYGEAGEADCHYWTPTPPEGDDWCLLAVYDTEDGPYALFGRDAYVAEQKRKQERTRQRAEAIAANQARKGDA